jgi:hypothetical protein
VNSFTSNYRFNVGAAGAVFPRPKQFFVSVDAVRDPFTGELLAGRYVLRSWVDDVYPPRVEILTERVTAGRPTIVARIVDRSPKPRSASGIDPTSLLLNYRGVLVEASDYDPSTGLAVFALPPQAPPFRRGRTRAVVTGADFQEAKNVSSPGGSVLPNTTRARVRIRGVPGTVVTWLTPRRRSCAGRPSRLVVAASPSNRVSRVVFFDGGRQVAVARRGEAGIYSATWQTRQARRGRHLLTAVAVTRSGGVASAERLVRVCRR